MLYIYAKIEEPSVDTYLIPKDFRGTIYIYYDQPNGTDKEYDGSQRIYRIPSDGVLLTKFGIKASGIRLNDPTKYYLIDKFNKKTEVEYLSLSDLGVVSDTSSIRIIGGGFSGSKCAIFYVGQPALKMKQYIYAQRDNPRKNEIHNTNLSSKQAPQ